MKEENLEHLLIASTEGPDDNEEWGVALSKEQADDIISLFRDLPDGERHILL